MNAAARGSHLVGRFLGSLRPGGPSAADVAWAKSLMLEGELDVWRKMSNPDRRHAVAVARRAERALGHEATRPILAAALLHDAGKTVCGLRTYGRVVATVSGAVAGHESATMWVEGRGFTRRVGLYLLHPSLGGDLLQIAGSDPLTVAWAREHHLPPAEWTLPRHIGDALSAADD